MFDFKNKIKEEALDIATGMLSNIYTDIALILA